MVSASVLSYQVILVRAFSIGQWHHFAYMVISIALLGFGASGTLLAALERKRTDTAASCQFSYASWFAISATLFAVALSVSFWLTQRVPFDPFLIIWDRRQMLYLGSYYLALFVPFFAGATAIGVVLTSESATCPRLYAFNMAGSGAGALLALILLSIVAVERAVVGVTALAQGAATLALFDGDFFRDRGVRRFFALAGVSIMAMLTLASVLRPPAVRLSQYTGLSYAAIGWPCSLSLVPFFHNLAVWRSNSNAPKHIFCAVGTCTYTPQSPQLRPMTHQWENLAQVVSNNASFIQSPAHPSASGGSRGTAADMHRLTGNSEADCR